MDRLEQVEGNPPSEGFTSRLIGGGGIVGRPSKNRFHRRDKQIREAQIDNWGMESTAEDNSFHRPRRGYQQGHSQLFWGVSPRPIPITSFGKKVTSPRNYQHSPAHPSNPKAVHPTGKWTLSRVRSDLPGRRGTWTRTQRNESLIRPLQRSMFIPYALSLRCMNFELGWASWNMDWRRYG